MISSSLIIRTFLVAWRSGAGLRSDNNLYTVGDIACQVWIITKIINVLPSGTTSGPNARIARVLLDTHFLRTEV